MGLFPDIHAEWPEGFSDRFGRAASLVLTVVAHLAILLALVLATWQTAPQILSRPMAVTLLPPSPKPPPAPPGLRAQFIAPQSIQVPTPDVTITVTPDSPGSGTAATSTSVVPPKPAPAAPAIQAPVAAAIPPDDLGPYYKKIIAYLQARLRTPAQKGRQGRELTATVHVISGRDGHVQSAELFISSGFDDLDQEAVGVVKRSDPLPPMPPDIRADHINVNIPVVFDFHDNGF